MHAACVDIPVSAAPISPREGDRFPGAGVMGRFEPLELDA